MRKIKLIKDKRGSVPLTLLVALLALVTIIMVYLLMINEKYSNSQMTSRITSRYIGESAIDVQKYLLHNKFDNKILEIYFIEETLPTGELARIYYKSDYLFDTQEIVNGGMTDINTAVDMIMTEVGKYSNIKNLKTNISMYSPDKPEDTEISSLNRDGAFLTEVMGGHPENLRGEVEDMYFTSEIEYVGAKVLATLKVSGLKIIRESFFSVDDTEMVEGEVDGNKIRFGKVRARFDTEDLKIETTRFQIKRR